MAVKGAYPRNPADEVEALAVATVADWVGDRGAVAHTGKGHAHGPDFRIDYTDERVGLGEVSWHADPAIEEMWANTFRRDRHQVIELDDGLGQWGLRLRAGANIGQLYKELPALIDSLAAARIRHFEVYDSRPRGDVADRARALGIDYISHASDDEPARAVFFMPSQPGVAIPSDPDVIVDWVEEVLAAPEFADVSAKLLALPADERHVFIMSGSRTDVGVDWRLRDLADSLPVRAPDVAAGITHVWVVSRFGTGPVAMWSAPTGWTAVPIGRPPANE